MGRDMLPPLHHAVLHDQLHPVTPTAACSKLRTRLIPLVGDAIRSPPSSVPVLPSFPCLSRLRFLPPIDDNSFHVLRAHSIAVLDSFPVGMHLPILEAMAAGVPVVSAPTLQECTNSHAIGIAESLQLKILSFPSFSWPTTPEEYAVFAMRLAREPQLRLYFDPRHGKALDSLTKHSDLGSQIFSFASKLTR
jgi:hypothetical protein